MPSSTLIDWIDHHARITPAATAISDGSRHISYAELGRLSRRVAARTRRVTQAERPLMCIYQDRSVANLVAMIGILRAGGSYTVLETGIHPDYALKRLGEIAPDVLVTDPGLQSSVAALGVPMITCEGLDDQACEDLAAPCENEIAYVLFTSGSTGTPKGVMVKHSNIAHYASALYRYLGIAEPLRYAHVSSLAADLGNTSIFLALYSGGAVFLVPDSCRKDSAAFFDFVQAHRLDFLKMTPSHWSALAGAGGSAGARRPHLRYLLLGGEILSVSAAADIVASGVTDHLVNHYGPTETTVGVVAHEVSDADLTGDHGSIPIGSPFGETRALVIDAEGRAVDTGIGELYIGGPSVSAGYRNAPQQTAASFVSLPHEPRVFYRTGDKVLRSAAGLLFCLGRVDRQVKIGGYRIELDHVEAEVLALPQVAACAVESVQVGSSVALVAALVCSPHALRCDAEEISEALTIPSYMRPRFYRFYQHLPLNKNGKVDREAIKAEFLRQVEQPRHDAALGAPDGDDAVMRDIRHAWSKYLRFGSYAAQDSLFAVGGDSLTAIQIISELQVKGYAITMQGFLDNPTMAGLHRSIAMAGSGRRGGELPAVRTRHLSAAQQEFFRGELADGNHWSQAILLECLAPVDPGKLADAVTWLARCHASLRTGYARTEHGVEATERPPSSAGAAAFSHHQVPSSDDEAYQALLLAHSASLQDRLDIARGDVFHACLISSPGRHDNLLLLAHHLAVDAVSWRVMIDDIVRCYDGLARGELPRGVGDDDRFWRWTQHLLEAEEVLRGDLAFWPTPPAQAADRDRAPPAFEHESQTCWSYFSEQECAAIVNHVIRPRGTSMDAVMLAAFALTCQHVFDDGPIDIAVESYGRATLNDSVDVTRTTGWFTSTFPLAARDWQVSFADMLACVEQRVKKVPHLGVAYGLLHSAALPVPRVSFNYLGQFNLPQGETIRFAHAGYHPGPVRGRNRRQYDLTLTTKLHAGAVVLDCNFSSQICAPRVEAMLQAVRTMVLQQAGLAPAPLPCLIQSGTSAGLLAFVPSGLLPAAAGRRDKAFAAVLLTGATGFIGCHVLERLLATTRGDIHCIVRADNDDLATQRLLEAARWYSPDTDWRRWLERVKVLAGDVAQDDFGLSRADYTALVGRVEAIYHFAADTRLFGGRHEFFKNNVDGLDNVIRFARQCGDAEIHYMSTLAVAGVNRGAQAKLFSETDLHIGQDFNNNYEVSKFESEKRLNDYLALGGKVWIYRSGNVAADSRTARFQRNAQDNRFIQTIMALVRNGEYSAHSEDAIVLSPVDVVAAGLVAISLAGDAAPGVYHVESSDPISYDDIYRSLRDLGLLGRAVGTPTLDKILLARQDVQDKIIALGRFWAQRPPRNVIYNNAKTTALLATKGIRFPRLDRAWLYALFDGLDCVKLAASHSQDVAHAAPPSHSET